MLIAGQYLARKHRMSRMLDDTRQSVVLDFHNFSAGGMCGNEGRGAQESEDRMRDVRGRLKAARRRVRIWSSVGVGSEVMVQVQWSASSSWRGKRCESEARSDWLESRPWSVGTWRCQPSLRSAWRAQS